MIVEAIFRALLTVPEMILNAVPVLDFTIPDGVLSGLSSILGNIGFFLPIRQLMPILYISLSIDVARLGMAILMRIKSFIPTMGT